MNWLRVMTSMMLVSWLSGCSPVLFSQTASPEPYASPLLKVGANLSGQVHRCWWALGELQRRELVLEFPPRISSPAACQWLRFGFPSGSLVKSSCARVGFTMRRVGRSAARRFNATHFLLDAPDAAGQSARAGRVVLGLASNSGDLELRSRRATSRFLIRAASINGLPFENSTRVCRLGFKRLGGWRRSVGSTSLLPALKVIRTIAAGRQTVTAGINYGGICGLLPAVEALPGRWPVVGDVVYRHGSGQAHRWQCRCRLMGRAGGGCHLCVHGRPTARLAASLTGVKAFTGSAGGGPGQCSGQGRLAMMG